MWPTTAKSEVYPERHKVREHLLHDINFEQRNSTSTFAAPWVFIVRSSWFKNVISATFLCLNPFLHFFTAAYAEHITNSHWLCLFWGFFDDGYTLEIISWIRTKYLRGQCFDMILIPFNRLVPPGSLPGRALQSISLWIPDTRLY